MQSPRVSDEQLAWERSRSLAITSDVIWKLDAYRAALFFRHVARVDCRTIHAARPEDVIARQLLAAAGSIGANLAEGYTRSTRSDRVRFLDYALGSTRECVTWYEAAREALPDAVIDDRLCLLMRIRSLLLGMIRSIRTSTMVSTRFEP